MSLRRSLFWIVLLAGMAANLRTQERPPIPIRPSALEEIIIAVPDSQPKAAREKRGTGQRFEDVQSGSLG